MIADLIADFIINSYQSYIYYNIDLFYQVTFQPYLKHYHKGFLHPRPPEPHSGALTGLRQPVGLRDRLSRLGSRLLQREVDRFIFGHPIALVPGLLVGFVTQAGAR